LSRLASVWEQGQHILVTGSTGSGKTELAHELDEIRIRAGSFVVVFVCKLQPDETLRKSYPAVDGWVRWKTWKRRPSVHENRILLWPDVEGRPILEATKIMQDVFSHALDEISRSRGWLVHIDEGFLLSSPHHLGLGNRLGMMYALMRASNVTLLTLGQRPAYLPVSIYANLSHAFIGRASELPDLKRLADMGGRESSRDLQRIISMNGRHDFTWVPVGQHWPAEQVNLAK
jgi:energy-coupling factor transporter ATP-binding protein EcfA2